jgi:hypothetical protein
VAIRKSIEDGLHDQLRRRTRDQHRRRHLEVEPPEFAAADDVGERLACGAPLDERLVARGEAVRLRRLRVGEEALGRPAEHVLGEQPRIEIGLGG